MGGFAARRSDPRIYPNMREAIREVRSNFSRSTVRIGLAGVSVPPSKLSASVLLPCRNVAMAAVQITKLTTQLQDTFAPENRCDVLCSRGLSGLLGAAGRQVRDRRRGICREGRCAELRHAARHQRGDLRHRRRASIRRRAASRRRHRARSPIKPAAGQVRCFRKSPKHQPSKSDDNGAAPSSTGEPSIALKPTEAKAQDRDLFVRRSINGPSR